jgi:hypothetical protein
VKKKTGFLEVYNGKLFIHPDVSDYSNKRVLRVDFMNDYDNSLNIARDYINSIGVDDWYTSSTVDFADEYDVDQSMLDSFLDSVLPDKG